MAIGNAIELQRGLGGLSTLPSRDKSDRTEAVQALGSEIVDLDEQSVLVNRVSNIVIRHVSFGRPTD